jgi:predicted HicB family RNase H-like nuclease
MMFRVAPEIHRKAALAAELAGKSLNQWAEEVLGKAAG